MKVIKLNICVNLSYRETNGNRYECSLTPVGRNKYGSKNTHSFNLKRDQRERIGLQEKRRKTNLVFFIDGNFFYHPTETKQKIGTKSQLDEWIKCISKIRFRCLYTRFN